MMLGYRAKACAQGAANDTWGRTGGVDLEHFGGGCTVSGIIDKN